MSEKMPRTFEYLLNAMEHAGQFTNPAEHGYAEKRRAVFQHVQDLWDDYMRLLREKQDRLEAVVPEDARTVVPIKVRPMLVNGMLAADARGPMILLDSEQDPKEQVISLWHETLHLIGLTDEWLVEEYAMALADACPAILRKLAHNINVPDDARVPQSHASCKVENGCYQARFCARAGKCLGDERFDAASNSQKEGE